MKINLTASETARILNFLAEQEQSVRDEALGSYKKKMDYLFVIQDIIRMEMDLIVFKREKYLNDIIKKIYHLRYKLPRKGELWLKYGLAVIYVPLIFRLPEDGYSRHGYIVTKRIPKEYDLDALWKLFVEVFPDI